MIVRPRLMDAASTPQTPELPPTVFWENGVPEEIRITKAHAAKIDTAQFVKALDASEEPELYERGYRFYWEVEDARGFYKTQICALLGCRSFLVNTRISLDKLTKPATRAAARLRRERLAALAAARLEGRENISSLSTVSA